jgi:DNA-binding transcriptional regulator YiaG
MTPHQIKALRESRQMTQEEFARLLGLGHRASVSRLESGTRKATGTLLAFLQHLAANGKNPK